jgi:hypothetical protein
MHCVAIITHQRFVNTTPNPKATKNRRGELLPPPPPPPDPVEVVPGAGTIGDDGGVRVVEGGGELVDVSVPPACRATRSTT